MDFPRSRPERHHRRLPMSLLSILIGYVLLLVLVRVFERNFLFFPNYPGRLEGDWEPAVLVPEDVWLTSADGTRLHAWWIRAAHAKFTFVAFHGNASNIANRAGAYEFLRGTPASVLALEYRGYGKSEGKPSEAGLYMDGEAAYRYLVKEKGVDPRLLIAYGQSLGTAVAAHLAARPAVGGGVLEAPFPSASNPASKIYWFLPGLSLLVYGQLDTRSNLKKISAPVLIVHCTQDPVLPFQFGKEVYRVARPPKYFAQIEGYCHEEACLVAPDQYRAALRNFLATLAPGG